MKFNAARRVRNILAQTEGFPDSEPTSTVWCNVLGIVALKDSDFEAVRLLGLLKREIRSVRDEVESLGLENSTYADTFNNLSKVTDIGNLDAQWTHHGRYITREILNQLDIFSQYSSIDEPVVPSTDFEELNNDLLTFRENIMQSDIDGRLKAFVESQIDTLRRAIREYPIRGAEAIKAGDAAILATAASERDLIREHQGEEVLRKTGGFWDRLRKLMPNVVINVDPGRVLGDVDWQKALESGSDLADKF